MGVADVKASVMSAFASCWAWYGAVMGPILLSDIGWVGALFQYRTTKYIVVDYWVVGVFHKSCQAAIIAYIIWQLASDRAWVVTNTPSSTVNAWASRGDSYAMYEQADYDQAFPAQCDDPPDFYYSKDFIYNSPECLYVVPEQLVTKGISSVSLVTFFLSKKVQGEPCGTQRAIQLEAACAGPDGGWTSGVWTEMTNGQCECTRSQSVYPVGVDHMLVSFEHTYSFPDSTGSVKNWMGASTISDPDDVLEIEEVLDTTLKFDDKDDVVIPGGKPVSMRVDEWLEMADVNLDDMNTIAGEDALEDGKYPRYRMTGTILQVNIDYGNGDPSTRSNKKVEATVTTEKQLIGWAGPGSERVHIKYPEGEQGKQSYDYVDRYGQGIVFSFKATGQVYVFDVVHLVNTLVLGIVMLGIANTLADFFAFNLLPKGHSELLKTFRQEKVDRNSRWADMALKATLAALSFKTIDVAKDKVLDAPDIVRVLASAVGDEDEQVGGEDGDAVITYENAHAMARMALKDRYGQIDHDGLDFVEYMCAQDAGTLDFNNYLKYLTLDDDVPEEERERCKAAWKEGIEQSRSADAAEGAKKRERVRAALARQGTQRVAGGGIQPRGGWTVPDLGRGHSAKNIRTKIENDQKHFNHV